MQVAVRMGCTGLLRTRVASRGLWPGARQARMAEVYKSRHTSNKLGWVILPLTLAHCTVSTRASLEGGTYSPAAADHVLQPPRSGSGSRRALPHLRQLTMSCSPLMREMVLARSPRMVLAWRCSSTTSSARA